MKPKDTQRSASKKAPLVRSRRARISKRTETALGQLTRAELVKGPEETEPAYFFKHALVQDTIRATLLRNENKRLHLLVAYALEEVNEKRLDEYAAALAHHFAEGEDDAKTFEYSIRAGDNAARIFANDEALVHYGRAIPIAERGIATREQIIHLYQERGRVLEVTARYAEALASYQGLHELAEKRQDRALELASLMLRAPLHSAPLPTFDAELAKQLLLDALGTARELGDEVAEARVLWNLSLLSVHTLHPADGLMYGELSLALAEKLNLREQCAYTLHDLFIPYRFAGQIERARAVQRQSRQLFRELDNKPMLADNLGMASQFAMYEGKLDQAIEFATEGLAISNMVGNPFGVYFNGQFLAIEFLERGELSPSLELINERFEKLLSESKAFNAVWAAGVFAVFYAQFGAKSLSERMERYALLLSMDELAPMFREGMAAMLGRIYIARGDHDRAAAALERGTATPDFGGALQPGAVYMPFARAELALCLGNFADALKFLEPQEAWARANEYRLLLPENLYLQGRARMGRGEWELALTRLQEGRALAQEMACRRILWQILATMTEIARTRGNPTEAESYRQEAHAILKYILEHMPPELHEGFLNLPRVREVMG